MNAVEQIEQSLEQLAEAGVDIVPLVYAQFFEQCPAAKPLFATREAQTVQGKMVNELIQTVLDQLEVKPYSATMVRTMVDDHDSWGVDIAMYDAFLAAFLHVLCHTQGVTIAPETQALWQQQLSLLREGIAAQLLEK